MPLLRGRRAAPDKSTAASAQKPSSNPLTATSIAENDAEEERYKAFEDSHDNMSFSDIGDFIGEGSDDESVVGDLHGPGIAMSKKRIGSIDFVDGSGGPTSPSRGHHEVKHVLKTFGNMLSAENTEIIQDGGLGKLGKHAARTAVICTQLIYVVGLAAIVCYAFIVRFHSPTLGAMHTIIPALLHVSGTGATIFLKLYYDFSPEVGHLESMYVIVRSRFWLFPGLLGPYAKVNRSTTEREAKAALASRPTPLRKPALSDSDANLCFFDLVVYLQRCQFPEFRCLFRAIEKYPWTKVSAMASAAHAKAAECHGLADVEMDKLKRAEKLARRTHKKEMGGGGGSGGGGGGAVGKRRLVGSPTGDDGEDDHDSLLGDVVRGLSRGGDDHGRGKNSDNDGGDDNGDNNGNNGRGGGGGGGGEFGGGGGGVRGAGGAPKTLDEIEDIVKEAQRMDEEAKNAESLADAIVHRCQNQIMATFPVLDVLNCCGSVPVLCNPLNYLRWAQRFTNMLLGKHTTTYDARHLKYDETFTRSEEIEKNDITPKDMQKLPYFQQAEPKPWGTLRLSDFEGRFKALHLRINFLSSIIFLCLFTGYLVMIFGEINFYSRLDIAHRNYNHPRDDEALLSINTTDPEAYQDRLEELFSDDAVWGEEFSALHARAPQSVLLLFCILPFALQASALITETIVLPLIVIETVQAHVENFTVELDQYLTVLAVNKGTLMTTELEREHSSQHRDISAQQQKEEKIKVEKRELLHAKIKLSRDVALPWRFHRFVQEVEHDSEVINSSVALIVVNFMCHLVPLNVYVFDRSSCIPMWVVIFTTAQWIGLLAVIKGGIECNEAINGGIDSLLNDWQLRFNTISWSGGFTKISEDGKAVGFVVKDPPGETKEDITQKQEAGESDYGAMVMSEQQGRLQAIVRVLKYYEEEDNQPFRVLGVNVTKEILALMFGFFGGQIVGIFSSLIDHKDDLRAQFMCHGWA